jgi:hypothetical protein
MATSKVRSYITYALACFNDKGHASVTLKAMGRAINKTVAIGENQLFRWWASGCCCPHTCPPVSEQPSSSLRARGVNAHGSYSPAPDTLSSSSSYSIKQILQHCSSQAPHSPLCPQPLLLTRPMPAPRPPPAEIIKRRVVGLHQITELGSVDMVDAWEPKEEGLTRLEITRQVSAAAGGCVRWLWLWR